MIIAFAKDQDIPEQHRAEVARKEAGDLYYKPRGKAEKVTTLASSNTEQIKITQFQSLGIVRIQYQTASALTAKYQPRLKIIPRRYMIYIGRE